MSPRFPRPDRTSVRIPVLLPGPSVGVALDLSATGVGLLAPRPLPVGENVRLELALPERGRRPVRVVAQIAWCRPQAGSTRLRFRAGARLVALGVREALLLGRIREAAPAAQAAAQAAALA